ncbi:RNase H domain-containing protein [Trichonephila clavipes]|uniref:RNase H domain-containing protein n=1 Tax=Trichonephila clavipes TaxID=2585209 RepID=A0A8X6WK44_TRICX|nr:RNase H domain-containing protein [Trichonephila clavipes]
MNPLKNFPNVFFHEELLSFSSKKNQHLRQLALETIHNTPPDAVHIFTDGSKFDSGNTGSGVVIKNQDVITKIKRRNPNHSSLFRSELIAINAAPEHMMSIKGSRDIWIFTDSKSLIQYLSNWRNIGDRIGLNIIDNVKTFSTHNDIHLQWIPSHVDLCFNNQADELAKEGFDDPIDSSDLLTYNEIYSKVKTDRT